MPIVAPTPTRTRRAATVPAAVAQSMAQPSFGFDGDEALRALRLVVRLHESGGRIRFMPPADGRPACICVEPPSQATDDVYSEALLTMRALTRLLDPWTDELGTFLVEATNAHVDACLTRASGWRGTAAEARARLAERASFLEGRITHGLSMALLRHSERLWARMAREIVWALDAADEIAGMDLRPARVEPDITDLFGGRQ